MKRRSRKKAETHTKDKIKKYVRLLAVPIAVLLLSVSMALAGRDKTPEQRERGGSGAETGERADPLAETGKDEFDLSKYRLEQDEVPELTALVQSYCQAKIDSDPEAMERVFGRVGLSGEELDAERVKMEQVRLLVEGYENITCYTVEGAEPGTYVIYPYFDIRYKGAGVLVPSFTWSYAKKDADGKFYMTQEVTDGEAEHIKRVSELEDVKSMSRQAGAQRQEAIAEDPVLQQIYLGVTALDGGDTGDETDSLEGSGVEIMPETAPEEKTASVSGTALTEFFRQRGDKI